MNRALQVRVDGLTVTAMESLKSPAVFLPPQVRATAELQPGERVEVRNLSTGYCFLAEVRCGRPGQVRVNGCEDPGLGHGDLLQVIAGDRRPNPPPGACTFCLCEGNAVIEYRHFTAPAVVPEPELAGVKYVI